MVFVVGLGIVMTFARVEKGTARMQPDPIPAREPKGVLKVASIGASVLVVGLVVLAALGRPFGSEWATLTSLVNGWDRAPMRRL
jgi:hypothetical protein